MGIKIKWDSQADQNLDAVEVYRSLSPIDSNNPGTPIATLAGTATEYEDTNVKVGNTYYYCVAVKKGSDRSFATNQTQGYYSNLGPGSAKILRGDWVRGFFGEIAPADWVTYNDVIAKMKDALKSTTGLTFANNTTNPWYKFVYKGKILFIPLNNFITANWQNAYNAGFVYGTDDFGKTPDGDAGNVNQRCVITVGGYQFIARCIRMSDKPTTQYLTAAADFNDSEWKSTYSRLKSDANAFTDPTIQSRVNDVSSLAASACPHLADATNVASIAAATPEVLSKSLKTANNAWLVVLELLP